MFCYSVGFQVFWDILRKVLDGFRYSLHYFKNQIIFSISTFLFGDMFYFLSPAVAEGAVGGRDARHPSVRLSVCPMVFAQ